MSFDLRVNKIIKKTFTYNPASTADAAGVTTSVTVTGARKGDLVLFAPGNDMLDTIFSGYVSATDTVEIRMQNESTGTRDILTSTSTLYVIRI